MYKTLSRTCVIDSQLDTPPKMRNISRGLYADQVSWNVSCSPPHCCFHSCTSWKARCLLMVEILNLQHLLLVVFHVEDVDIQFVGIVNFAMDFKTFCDRFHSILQRIKTFYTGFQTFCDGFRNMLLRISQHVGTDFTTFCDGFNNMLRWIS